jgi:chorismate mutase
MKVTAWVTLMVYFFWSPIVTVGARPVTDFNRLFIFPPLPSKNQKEYFLNLLRYKIDRIDEAVYELVAARMKLAEHTLAVKPEGQILDSSRESRIYRQLQYRRRLRPEFVEKLWGVIMEESRYLQEIKKQEEEGDRSER